RHTNAPRPASATCDPASSWFVVPEVLGHAADRALKACLALFLAGCFGVMRIVVDSALAIIGWSDQLHNFRLGRWRLIRRGHHACGRRDIHSLFGIERGARRASET